MYTSHYKQYYSPLSADLSATLNSQVFGSHLHSSS